MGLASGEAVVGGAGSPIEDLAHNNALVHARYSGILLAAGSSGGIAPSSASYIEIYRVAVPACLDEIGLTVTIECDDLGADGGLRATSNGDGALTATSPVSAGTGRIMREFSIAASLGAKDTISVYATGTSLVVYSCAVRWSMNKGATASADPEASGFRSVSTSLNSGNPYETAADRAVSDELLNRMMTNPQAVWADRPIACFGAGDDVVAPSLWSITSSSRDPVAALPYYQRYRARVRWVAHVSTSATTWEVQIVDTADEDNTVTITEADTPVSWGGVDWYEGTMDLEVGDRDFEVSLAGDGANALTLLSLQAFVEEPP